MFLLHVTMLPHCFLLHLSYNTIRIIVHSQPQQTFVNDDDDLYVLIDEITVYTCRGTKNEIKITEDNIDIVIVYTSSKLPEVALYTSKNFGEIGVTLQVPIIDDPAEIRFDLPYTVKSETGILDQECDKYSGVIERGNRHRYCDICGFTAKLETDVNSQGHLFLPEVARGTKEKFASGCNKIASNIYEFSRTINLPGRHELEARINEKIQGLTVRFVNVLTKNAEKPAIKQDDWFMKSADEYAVNSLVIFNLCNFCPQAKRYIFKKVRLKCKNSSADVVEMIVTLRATNNWAKRCLHHTAHIAACYTVEFNHRTTTSFADVIQFLKENDFPNQESVTVSLPEIQGTSQHLLDTAEINDIALPLAERCVAKMSQKMTHLRRYCKIFRNDTLCCSHCPDVCQLRFV
ncbi:unnamed protein product [Onchocerca flexuosa]|uniref:RHD domain-containing protein n=1 Tax=Onchocerca flexuosa TaxID=387005 RepID=A0A183GZ73_9BILA|nr:unnamed protein product [Onchocerca flexuosa]